MDNTQLEAIIAAILSAGVASAKPQLVSNDLAVSAYYAIREEIRKRGGPLSSDLRPKQT
jgi:hypothetical protein